VTHALTPSLDLREVVLARGAWRSPAITFEVPAGSGLAIVGPNGAGKSTLLAAIAGLHPVERGVVAHGGHSLAGLAPAARPTGILLQDGGLWPHQTVSQQVELVRRASVESVDRASGSRRGVTADRIRDLAERLGIATLLERKPGALSGGEAQRCALLRTIALGRPILLLDEPFAAQHRDGIARVAETIRTLLADGAIVIIAGDSRDLALPEHAMEGRLLRVTAWSGRGRDA